MYLINSKTGEKIMYIDEDELHIFEPDKYEMAEDEKVDKKKK